MRLRVGEIVVIVLRGHHGENCVGQVVEIVRDPIFRGPLSRLYSVCYRRGRQSPTHIVFTILHLRRATVEEAAKLGKSKCHPRSHSSSPLRRKSDVGSIAPGSKRLKRSRRLRRDASRATSRSKSS